MASYYQASQRRKWVLIDLKFLILSTTVGPCDLLSVQSCECGIRRTLRENFIKFATNFHLDSRMHTYILVIKYQRSRALWPHVYPFLWMWYHMNALMFFFCFLFFSAMSCRWSNASQGQGCCDLTHVHSPQSWNHLEGVSLHPAQMLPIVQTGSLAPGHRPSHGHCLYDSYY